MFLVSNHTHLIEASRSLMYSFLCMTALDEFFYSISYFRCEVGFGVT